MLSLKDLKDYDVKNIDIHKAVKNIQGRRDILLNIGIVFITFFLVMKVTNHEKLKISQSGANITALEEKVGAISGYEVANKTFTDFVSNLPKGLTEPDSIIAKINTFAVNRNIQILSFTPSGRESNATHTKIILKLNVTAQTYEDLGRFISDIENSENNLRIESWAASSGLKAMTRRSDRSAESSDNQISADIEIAAIFFKK